MLFPSAKFGDTIIGVDAHTILVPAPPSPSPVPVPMVPHPFVGSIFMWHAPNFPSADVFINGMPACTVGAKSISAHFPTPPGIWWLRPPTCFMKWFLTHVGTVALSIAFSTILNVVGAVTGTLTPTTRAPASEMDPPPNNPDVWSALQTQISSHSWMSIFRALLPPAVLPIAEGDVSLGSPTVTVNGAPLAFVGPLTAGSCTEIPIVPNANVVGFTNVMVGVTLTELLMQMAWNAVHGAAGLLAGRIASRAASRVTGEPIDIVSGAVVEDPLDFELPGPIPFRWIRHYTNLLVKDGPLGWCWSHEYHRTLDFEEEAIIFLDEEGRSHRFPRLNDDQPEFEIKLEGLKLRRIDDDHYELDRRNEPTMGFTFNSFAPRAVMTELRGGNGNRIRFEYDREGRLVQIIDSAFRRLVLDYYPSNKIRSIRCVVDAERDVYIPLLSFEYDDSDNLTAVLDANGNRETYAYDDEHRMTRRTNRLDYSFHYEYNEAGQCVKSWGDDGLYSVELEYLPSVNITKVTEPSGGTYLYRYDENSLVREIIDPYGHARLFDYDENGNLVDEIDENGNLTAYEYNEFGNRIQQTDSLGGVATWQYDSLGRLRQEIAVDGMVAEYETDEFGKPIPMTSEDEEIFKPNHCEYDILGRYTAIIADGKQTTYHYDNLSRLCRVVYPDDTTESNTFDAEGNVLTYTNRLGHTWRYRYDSWNKLVEEIDPLGNATRYDYNKWDKIIRVKDANGNVTEYERDLCNRLVGIRQNGRLQERYELDPVGKLLERIGPDGQSLLKIGRIHGNLAQEKIFSSGEHISFEYDNSSRIVAATGADFSQRRAYDEAGRVTLEEIDGQRLEQTYDESGLCIQTTVEEQGEGEAPAELTITREFDPETNIVTLTVSLGNRYQLEYEGRHLISRKTPWALEESFSIDDERIVHHEMVSPSGLRRRWRYNYRPNGDLQSLDDSEIGFRRYTYDAAEQLVGVLYSNGHIDRYAYDPVGNLVATPEHAEMQIGEGNHLQGWSGGTAQYDERGNLIQRQTPEGTIHFHYNTYDLLEQVELPDGSEVRYRYDALRRRIAKEMDGKTIQYLWDGDRLVAEGIEGEWRRIYIYARPDDLAPLSFVDYRREEDSWSGKAYCIHTNHLHTPIAITDEKGEVVWSVELTPYGVVRQYHVAGIEFNLRLPGQYFDAETGLHYNRHRYYDPAIGRYIQYDPIGLAGGINPYAYPQNPLSSFDFLGLNNNHDNDPQQRQQTDDEDEAGEQKGTPTPDPYVNNNPKATADEIRVGETLNNKAQAGELPGVQKVEGAAEIPGQRSGDYRFTDSDGNVTSADLYQPQSGNPRSIESNIIEKSGQAKTVVVELGQGNSGQISDQDAQQMAQSVVTTPDTGIDRVLVVKNGEIIADHSRSD